ncbi:MAG: CDP-glycerol glycerophosphotransferase family protein [Chlorobi bacterium]|nr:CDP-glycerol glycerophosphotransferase family protein [Chlorobiota bacterium]MCI0715048.1 CDP-glycerol glycerophosphotransferase family protein [Chlorobiota bacterium]
MMHKISSFLGDYDCYFSPYYADTFFLKELYKAGYLDFTVMGRNYQQKVFEYAANNNLKLDFEGRKHNYDLVITCSDLVIQKNIRGKRIVLVQEGMTDPENFMYYLVKYLNLPRYLASTSTTGLSNAYRAFCVASYGYRDLFQEKGSDHNKMVVSGIPNFDNAAQYFNNDFPHKNFVLAATSDARETYKYENRKKFILNALRIADGRKLIFKLHPNEKTGRAVREIEKYAPQAFVYASGNTNHMVANCDVLITKYSSVVFLGLALGKEVHSDFDVEKLKKMSPIQNNGKSAENIAEVCKIIIEDKPFNAEQLSLNFAGSYYEVIESGYVGAFTS